LVRFQSVGGADSVPMLPEPSRFQVGGGKALALTPSFVDGGLREMGAARARRGAQTARTKVIETRIMIWVG